MNSTAGSTSSYLFSFPRRHRAPRMRSHKRHTPHPSRRRRWFAGVLGCPRLQYSITAQGIPSGAHGTRGADGPQCALWTVIVVRLVRRRKRADAPQTHRDQAGTFDGESSTSNASRERPVRYSGQFTVSLSGVWRAAQRPSITSNRVAPERVIVNVRACPGRMVSGLPSTVTASINLYRHGGNSSA
jgi:hypothetical protein